jgi:hypothetical protein
MDLFEKFLIKSTNFINILNKLCNYYSEQYDTTIHNIYGWIGYVKNANENVFMVGMYERKNNKLEFRDKVLNKKIKEILDLENIRYNIIFKLNNILDYFIEKYNPNNKSDIYISINTTLNNKTNVKLYSNNEMLQEITNKDIVNILCRD